VSSALDTAVRELRDVWREHEEIVRVDVDEAGGLVLTATGPVGTRWFTHDDRGLIERHPERDAALPLSSRLREANDWRVLSYRPGRRAVVLMSRAGSQTVVKGHRSARSARAAVSQGVAESALRRSGLRVPRLLSHDGGLEALVFEYLPARELELDAGAAGHLGRLGERLAYFQRDAGAQDLRVFGARQELDVLALWEGKVQHALGALPDGWSATRARLARRAEELPAPVLGLAHRDLHDRQLFLVDGQLTLLDFDLLCTADVALDAGNLVAHLRWRALQGLHGADEAGVRACEHAFLAGLGRDREPGFTTRLSFFVASACLRLALVYGLRPRWSALTPRLVELAAAELESLAHTG